MNRYLSVIETPYRAVHEEQCDTGLWFTHAHQHKEHTHHGQRSCEQRQPVRLRAARAFAKCPGEKQRQIAANQAAGKP